jgi:hypothetical protein
LAENQIIRLSGVEARFCYLIPWFADVPPADILITCYAAWKMIRYDIDGLA